MSDALALARERYPPIWTIYDGPRDYPGKIVVRVWYGETPEPDVHVAASLGEARRYINGAGGVMWLGRQPGDDAYIVESWI